MTGYAVDVVHGYVETADDAAAVQAVADRAWALGCRTIVGRSDRATYVMPTETAALALLAAADGVASSWWRIRLVT